MDYNFLKKKPRALPYARFFSRFRLPIRAISIGPIVNSPAPAFLVSCRK